MKVKAKYHAFRLALVVSSILVVLESLGAGRKFS
jgi:hypothetical protein